MQLQDFWTNTFASPGTRTMKPPDGEDYGYHEFIIHQKGEKVHTDAKGAKVLESPTPIVWLIGRTQILKSDFDDNQAAIHAFQSSYELRTLSEWRKGMKKHPECF